MNFEQMNLDENKKPSDSAFKFDRTKLVLGFVLILGFAIGYGTSWYRTSVDNNNNLSAVQQTVGLNSVATDDAASSGEASQAPVQNAPTGTQCLIKAKASKTGIKYYYLPGQLAYSRTKPDQCFNSEADAKSAGFKASKSPVKK